MIDRTITHADLRIICDVMTRWPGASLRVTVDQQVDAVGRLICGGCSVYDCGGQRYPFVDPIAQWPLPVPSDVYIPPNSARNTFVTYYFINGGKFTAGRPYHTISVDGRSAIVTKETIPLRSTCCPPSTVPTRGYCTDCPECPECNPAVSAGCTITPIRYAPFPGY